MERAPTTSAPTSVETSLTAGALRGEYRRPFARTRVMAAYLVEPHALTRAEWLITRDRGF